MSGGVRVGNGDGQERIAQSANAQVAIGVLGKIEPDARQVDALFQMIRFHADLLQQQHLPLKDRTEQATQQATEWNQQSGPAVLFQNASFVEGEIAHPSFSIV
jgi:hypothetical protein